MARAKSKTHTKTAKRPRGAARGGKNKEVRGFSVKPAKVDSILVKLMPGAETLPQSYGMGYVILPWQDSVMVKSTHGRQRVVKRETLNHKAGEPFYIGPTDKGQAVSLRNAGGSLGIFQKMPVQYHPVPLPQPALPKSGLTIVTSGGTTLDFTVEVATTIDQWAAGLSRRPSVPPETGMLFDWSAPHQYSLWMKDMNVDLDMAFIRPDGKIGYIARNLYRGDETPIDGGFPARAVLEVAANAMADVEVGDVVQGGTIFPKATRPKK